ncbi:NADH dehydrogenase 1 alpha subcomplex assembly factor 3 [Gorgonomyces haynaldii]|nr:NADH dehydrogenase 1 alpha subcomplex assembly factor 3 [Gorgonomyces haynaldii]
MLRIFKRLNSTLSQHNIIDASRANLISSISDYGFTVGETRVRGPCFIANQTTLLWDVPQFGVGGPKMDVDPVKEGEYNNPESPFHGWSLEMFALLEAMEPKPEMLVIGTGSYSAPLPPGFKEYFTKMGIQVESTTSRKAGATYNDW